MCVCAYEYYDVDARRDHGVREGLSMRFLCVCVFMLTRIRVNAAARATARRVPLTRSIERTKDDDDAR